MDIGLKLIQAAACGVVALFGALLALSVPTNAQPFPQLPDGRVAVEIFGRRIGLLPSPSSLDRINFLPSCTAMSTFGKYVAHASPSARRPGEGTPRSRRSRTGSAYRL